MIEPPNPQPEQRKHSGVAREYRNEQIVVYWEPQLCIHSARCLQGLPQVFDNERRPWVDVSAASADEIAEVVQRCPTSALRYERLDGGEQEQGAAPTTIQARRDGPLWVRGDLQIIDQDGSVRQPHPCSALPLRSQRQPPLLRQHPPPHRLHHLRIDLPSPRTERRSGDGDLCSSAQSLPISLNRSNLDNSDKQFDNKAVKSYAAGLKLICKWGVVRV